MMHSNIVRRGTHEIYDLIDDDTRDKLNAVHRLMKKKRYPRNMMNKGF